MGYAHWNYDVAKAPTSNGLDVSDKIDGLYLEAWEHIKANLLPDHVLIRCYANAHTYGVEGYPHTDSSRNHDTTVVVYMNKNWRREWGGETVIYDGNKIVHAELPEFNRALVFNGADWHCARSVTRICPEQRRTLMFKCAKVNADPSRDRLQEFLQSAGADNHDHITGSLQHHLLMTYDILKAAGMPDGVCLAGGAHSIFGTNAFNKVCLSPERRDELVKVIGLPATELVEIFGKIDRPDTLAENIGADGADLRLTDGGTVRVNRLQLEALINIECANLDEQGELNKIRPLKEYWGARSRNDLSVYGD
jgi:hypothetical protein